MKVLFRCTQFQKMEEHCLFFRNITVNIAFTKLQNIKQYIIIRIILVHIINFLFATALSNISLYAFYVHSYPKWIH